MLEKVYLCAANPKNTNNMNTRFSLLAMSLMLTATLTVGCGSDDDPQPQTPEQDIPEQQPTLAGKYGGWTLGSNEYAPYIPSEGDTIIVTQNPSNPSLCDLYYVSPTWGTATLKNVSVEVQQDSIFVLSKTITATIREDHSAWDFSAPVDSIAMPNRNPQAGTTTIKNYPIVLTSGVIYPSHWQVDFKAYLVPRSEHIQSMSFRSGSIPQSQQ